MQTTNELGRSAAGFFEDPFDLEFFPANPVRLVPVDFCNAYRTIGKLDLCDSLQLAPVVFAIERPAAEAVVRSNRKLHEQGYGLLIFDGYRPWYVSKMFWEATAEKEHPYLADPAGDRGTTAAAPWT